MAIVIIGAYPLASTYNYYVLPLSITIVLMNISLLIKGNRTNKAL